MGRLSDWHDAATARRWDRQGHHTNPTRPEQLELLVTLLAGAWRPGCWLLDLGYGSGLVERILFDRIPAARIVGVDSSQPMMALARERLAGDAERFEEVAHDLGAVDSLAVPEHPYQFVLAVQSLHHLSHEALRAAYAWIGRRLEPGGWFLLMDRLRVEDAGTWPLLRAVWERQDREYGSQLVPHEGEDFAAHGEAVAARGDDPALLDEHLRWLRAAGLRPACLHLHGHRALIGAVKADGAYVVGAGG